MPGCEKNVFWLKDHLIRIHDFEDGKAEGATSQFGLCSKRERTVPSEKQRHYKRRFCPVKNCFKILVRLENHLHSVHDMRKKMRKNFRNTSEKRLTSMKKLRIKMIKLVQIMIQRPMRNCRKRKSGGKDRQKGRNLARKKLRT